MIVKSEAFFCYLMGGAGVPWTIIKPGPPRAFYATIDSSLIVCRMIWPRFFEECYAISRETD